ncbi:hypothetical protein AVEN_152949-1 [Araneus ventricosus]|uniref:Tc3 transposase DNA binding domain-containing protein n=1 Tax=Araneus ventricosus TaxID=182803 RepID=A0A4Y2AFK9_ARAVE|nr:hypothetical protein AVEN_152949-1 [Araneus ventricosus]
MFDKCIRSVPAAAKACFQDLSDFERGVIVGAREMGHSISEVAMKFDFPLRPFHECTVNIGYPVKHDWNTSPGLTSLVSNCIGRMHVYEYVDNIINP